MKKLLSLIVTVLLCLSMLFSTGCTNEFSGNFKEVSAAELEEIIDQVEDYEIDYSKGVACKFVLDIGSSVDMTMNLNINTLEDDLVMAGDCDMDIVGMAVNSKVYYTDGAIYTNTSTKVDGRKVEVKIKQEMDIYDYISGQISMGGESEFSLYDLINEYGEDAKFKLSTDENSTKVKVSFVDEGIDTEIIFVFDNNYELSALRAEAKGETEGQTFKFVLEYTPWSGTISLPSDLDAYSEATV